MIDKNAISEQFVNQVDYQIANNHKPNYENIADYLVSILPEETARKLEPIHVNPRLLYRSQGVIFTNGAVLEQGPEQIKPGSLDVMKSTLEKARSDVQLIKWDSMSVGEVLIDMTRRKDLNTEQIGVILSDIVEDRFNNYSKRSQDPNNRLYKAVNPLIKASLKHIDDLSGYNREIKDVAREFMKANQSAMENNRLATHSMG